jgi:hypothetical protein
VEESLRVAVAESYFEGVSTRKGSTLPKESFKRI